MALEPFSSRYLDFGLGPVHVADMGGVGEPVVCVHGLGGSHANWVAAAPHLRGLGHVTAPDFPGFGLTPPAGRAADIESNRLLLGGYLRSLGRPATLIASSMGAAIAAKQAAKEPDTVSRLVLVSPASPLSPGTAPDRVVTALFTAYALPGIAQAVMRARRNLIDPADIARWILQLCSARSTRIAPDVFALHVEVAERRRHMPGIDTAFIQAARSVVRFVARRNLFDRQIAAISCPTLVIHGRADRLVRYQSSQRLAELRPDWDLLVLDDVGHIAMLEVPVTFGRIVTDWAGGRLAA